MAVSEQEIKNICIHELQGARQTSDVSKERQNALLAYQGEPTGPLNETDQDGRSRATTQDVSTTVDGMVDPVVNRFTQDDKPIRFEAVNPEDEDQAEIESDACNHVVMELNDGFAAIQHMVFDALLSKNGILRVEWDTSRNNRRVEFTDISDEEFQGVQLQNPDWELVEHESITVETQQQLPTGVNGMGQVVAIPVTVPVTRHNAVFRDRSERQQLKVTPVAPENFGTNRDHYSHNVQEARFVYEYLEPSRSELIQMGFDPDVVDSIPSADNRRQDYGARGSEARTRNEFMENFTTSVVDRQAQRVKVHRCFINIDSDEDGETELHRILLANESIVLEDVEVNYIDYAVAQANIRPHRFIGYSVADRIQDVYEQKSYVLRQMFDNLNLANAPRTALGPNVNMDDWTDWTTGGVVRVGEDSQEPVNMANEIREIAHPDITQQGLAMMEFLESEREFRTGYGRTNQGIDLKVLGSNTGDRTALAVMRATEKKIDWAANQIAKTGIKDLFWLVREILRANADEPIMFKVGDKWQQTIPSQWPEDRRLSSKIGLGPAQRADRIQTLSQVIQWQHEMVMQGSTMVSQDDHYNAHQDWLDAAELGGHKYFTDPNSPEGQAAQEAKSQAMQQQQQMQQQQAAMMAQMQTQLVAMQEETKRMRDMQSGMIEQAKLAAQAVKDAQDQELERTELELKYGENVPGSAV